ncbi:hypothetical protein [Dysgonomonas macrotermitis]|uniref:C1q domain-containing protein n=1 Tax=Dysgonomonas macrotermitis TaxID=1346286 RepID=A0A1M4ZL07_9BACT|nr:hypothetical protein [Dysgonomonas macrotermitis]SHF18635.1 hypothetical protein SAMN05444362_104119 [Dysgonomonas macrotermitis]
MKKKILLLMGIFAFGITFAQIGIHTENPLGVFHVDAGRDNSATPTTTQLLNDVVAKVSSTGSINLGIGGVPSDNTQLDLLAPNKGLLFNKVALTSLTDIITVPNPEKGTVIYNTAYNNNMNEGYYYFNGSSWHIMRSSKMGTTRLNLLSNGASTSVTTATVSAGGYGGTRLSFTSGGSITISNTGRYVFMVNLYGSSAGGGVPGLYYLFLVKKGSPSTLLDGMTMTPFLEPTFSQPGCLAGTFEEGDEAEIYLAHNSANAVPWTLIANTSIPSVIAATSMFYWKLY